MAKIAFDYESIKNRIIKNLSSKSEWASFLDYGVIDNIISSIANEMGYEIQYSEYNSMENYWNLARNRSSLLQMSPMHGYIVPRKQASSGTVRVSTSESFDSSYSKNISIPKFFQFSGNGTYVCADNDYVLNANDDYIDINCMQGEVKEVSFLAEGLQYEEKTILDDSIDNSFFTLTVNGIEWTNVTSLYLYDNEQQIYQIRTLPNLKGITIRFGNDIFGKKLTKNDNVIFKYISTKGYNGNIFSSDIINSVESQAFDSNGNSVQLYCTNTSTFVGGVDYPSIDKIRELSPNVYQTGNRASSRIDYTTILEKINYLSKVGVWGAYETLKDQNKDPWGFIPSEENVVHLALLDSAYNEITESQKISIINTLHDLCDPTDLISFETVNKIPMVFRIDGTITSSAFTTAEVESSIKTKLSEVYGISKMNFGESIYDSDYVRVIDEIDGIDNHLSYIELYKEDYILTSNYYGYFELPIFPIDYKSVKLYIKNTSDENSEYEELATCDSNGNLIGSGIYITKDSNLNLNYGTGNINISNGLDSDYSNYLIKIVYQYIERNLKNSSRTNVLYYDDAVVNLNYK